MSAESRRVGIAVVPMILLAVAVVGYGFVIGLMIREGNYVWPAIVAGGIALGASTVVVVTRKPRVHRLKSKIINTPSVMVNDYRLVYASRKDGEGARSMKAIDKVSGVMVKVSNDDDCPQRVEVDVDINDKPHNRVVREVDIEPGSTTYIAVPLVRQFSLGAINTLSIRLKQAS
ncbi:MAG: hypothetical protein SV910_08390 [Chloroflexota bacterium]|nr:hypothetical protein [Chloroflexota bacterium]